MTRLLTAEEMRSIEGNAIETGGVTGLDLMERAGRRAVGAMLVEWPDLTPGLAVVLCGPGNNGGDGFVVARLLRARGWDVSVLAMKAGSELPPDARAMWQAWDGPVHPLSENAGQAADLVVDALFGTGLSRPLAPEIVETVRSQAGRVVALDMPSGWCADSGRWLGTGDLWTRADLTLTFHAPKRGHYIGDAPAACGRLRVVDIGLTSRDGTPLIAAPARDRVLKRQGHKYGHGHAFVLGGGPGQGGAARLAARAALRIGAGLVTLGVREAALPENAARLDAVMLARIEGSDDLTGRLEDGRISALCLGPGLGVGQATCALVRAALDPGRGVVLDADALTSFADGPEALFDAIHGPTVLTPHDGEFARLFPDLAAPLSDPATSGPAPSHIDAARDAAARSGAVVLLKGPDTIVAAPDGRCGVHAALYDRAVPWLATAGAGDVLSGVIAGLLARGLDPFDAACDGAWLHAEAARRFGPGLIAEDLPDSLPAILADL